MGFVGSKQIGATNSIEIDKSIQQLGAVFLVKDIGPLSYFPSVEALFDGHDMFLTQRKYVADLLQWVHLHEAKALFNSYEYHLYSKFHSSDFTDPQLYHCTIGALHYLGFTRPDIAFAVHCVSKFMHQPKDNHWQAVKCIL